MTNIGVPVSQISGIALESTPPIEDPIPEYLYLVSGGQTPASVLEINYDGFAVSRTMVLGAGESINQSGTGDNILSYGGYAFIPLLSTLNRIVRVNLSTMTRVDHLDLSIPAVDGGLGTAGITDAKEHNGYGYFVCKGVAYKKDSFWKVDLNTFTEITRIDTPMGYPYTNNPDGLLITDNNLFAFGTDFLKYDLATLAYQSIEPSANMYLDFGVASSNKQYGYFVPKEYALEIFKVRLDGIPQKIKTIPAATSNVPGYGVIIDMFERFSIWTEQATPSIVRKFDMSSETWTESLTIAGSSQPRCMKRVGNYVVLGDLSSPGKISKFSIDPFVFLDQSQMPTGYAGIKSILTI